jgi:hypothetical protein
MLGTRFSEILYKEKREKGKERERERREREICKKERKT